MQSWGCTGVNLHKAFIIIPEENFKLPVHLMKRITVVDVSGSPNPAAEFPRLSH